MFRYALTALILMLAGPATAGGDPASGSILTGWRQDGGQHVAGLSVRLAPGWKTYWRAPGEGGIPPRFNWSGSSNLASVEVLYPVPRVIDQNGLRSIGYVSDVVFPLLVTPHDTSKPVRLTGEIEIGVCEDICIPLVLVVRGELPATGKHDARIAAGLKAQPRQAGNFRCEITPIADGLRLTAAADLPEMPGEIAVIETGEPGVWVSPAAMKRDGGRLMAQVEMVPPNAQPFALARSEVRMTVIGNGRAVEMTGCR